jgi:hypothetical protein
MNDVITKCESELAGAIQAIQQPRTNFQLQHFVVGQHDTEPRRWWQCVLELQIKIQNLKRARIERRRMERRCAALHTLWMNERNEDARDESEIMALDMAEHDLAILGAMREAQALYAIFQSFPRSYTREDLDEAEAEYWRKRLVRQARHEVNACGSIGTGNQDSLEQIGISPGPLLAEARTCLEPLTWPSISLSQSLDTSRQGART